MSYMFLSNEQMIADEWSKFEGYTIRPSPSTVEYYTRLMESLGEKDRCFIYGSTPEIRSIFQKQNRAVVLIDQSDLMMRAMGLLTVEKAMQGHLETFVVSNWLDLPDFQESMNACIGDDAINMVPWNQFDTFFKNTLKSLKRNGLFVCHLLVKPDETLINHTIDEIAHAYHAGLIETQYDLASRLNFICYDRKTYKMGWQQTIHQIGMKNLKRFSPSFDFTELFGRCNSEFYCPPQSTFEKLAQQYFKIEEIFYPHEHDYCLYEPVYVLRKK